LEASKKPVIEAIGSAEQAAIEASELRAAADFATADEAALRASDALRRALEALRAVPDAAWRADMEQRIGLLDTRLKRLVDAIAVGRNVAALSSAIETAETDMREMAAGRWKADREAIDTLMQEANIPGSARAGAERAAARLESYQARHDALKELTGPIEEAIKARDYAGARALLDALRKKVVAPPLTADHVEFLDRLMSSYMQRIEVGDFWRMVAVSAAVLVALLAVAVTVLAVLWIRGGSAGSRILDLRKWRMRLAELTRKLEQDRDRATASDSVKSGAVDRLERSRAFELDGVAPAVMGAAPAEGLWIDVLVLAHRLVALGDAESARDLLDAAERAGLVVGSPRPRWLVDRGGPLAPKPAVRLARGCRAIEAAGAWADVWKGSAPAVRDLVAARVERWLAIANEWLPVHEDVPVFYERALFAAEQGKRELALSLLTGERESALSLMKVCAVPDVLKARIYVFAADLSLDLANVVSLRGDGGERAKPWPVLDRYQAPAPFASAAASPVVAASGAPAPKDPATLIMNARNYLALATQALVPAPGPSIGAAGLGASSPYGVSGSLPPAAAETSSWGDSASLRFLIGAATFRADLGSGQPQTEVTLGGTALGEPEPTVPEVFTFRSNTGTRSGIELRPSWSRLQPDLDALRFGVDERRMVRDLRLNWVTWCLNRGDEFGRTNPQVRMGFNRKAAWLACRYWLWARDSATPEAAVARAELRRLVDRVLDVREETGPGGSNLGSSSGKPRRSLGTDGWKPGSDPQSQDDRAVHELLLEIAGTEAPRCGTCGCDLGGLAPGTPCPNCASKPKCPQCGRDTVGGRCPICPEISSPPPPPPPPPPVLQNVWLLPKEAPDTPPVDGKPVINALTVIDPAMSTTPLDGMLAWIDTGANSPARAVGVFGYDLPEAYTVPLRPEPKSPTALLGGGKVRGMVDQLAELTFDGLKDIVGGFSVVLSRPTQSASSQTLRAQPQYGQEVSRVRVDGYIARPAAGKQPVPPIPVHLIEGSLFDISMVIAVIGVDAKPIAPAVDTTRYRSVGSEFGADGFDVDPSEAWRALAHFFHEELGAAQGEVMEKLEDRAAEREGKGVRAAKVASFALTILDLDFIRSSVRQLSLRAEKDRDADAKAAWARLDPTVRAAMDRLLRKFEEQEPGCMNAQRLKECFGLQIGVPPPPPPPPPPSGSPVPPQNAGEGQRERSNPACAKDFPLRAEFERLVDDVRASVPDLADRQWDYALDATCLRRELGRMKSQLGDQLAKVPDSVAAQIRGYIARADSMLSRLR
jgi:hypothetical protein